MTLIGSIKILYNFSVYIIKLFLYNNDILNCVKITQGGGVAAPVGGQIFSEILPYLEVNQGNEEEVEQIEQIQTPDILGKSIKEAEKILKESGLEIVIEDDTEGLDKENTFVQEQTPKSGIIVNKGSKVNIKYN